MDIMPEIMKDTIYGTTYLRSDTAVKKADLAELVEKMDDTLTSTHSTEYKRATVKWRGEIEKMLEG